MKQIILMLIGLGLNAIGVICIFDARVLTSKLFSFGDQNEATMGLKIVGVIFCIIGSFCCWNGAR